MNNITLCLGKFDVLHVGHIYHLKKAKEIAPNNRLVVAITADNYISLKPYFNENERKKALEILEWVDTVYICGNETGIPAIIKYKPAILVKGPDYLNIKDKVLQAEKQEVEKYGGVLKFIEPEITFSSTKLKKDNGNFLQLDDPKYSVKVILDFIEKVANIKVGIIGETILDVFQDVELDGQSPKSYCPSFTTHGEEIHQFGGAAYINRNIRNFCITKFITGTGFIIKLRYPDIHSNKKHFEIKTDNISSPTNLQNVCNELKNTHNLVLIADFGHGLFDEINLVDGMYLMVQTNSSNFGFNIANKWNKYRSKLVCLDRIEASLLLGKKINTIDKKIMHDIWSRLNSDAVVLTMHKEGSIYYDEKGSYTQFPAIAKRVLVDSIGAGDIFYSFASLAHYLHFEPHHILFIASLAAALNTQWLCAAEEITPQMLIDIGKITI
jgi:cytidyltransferase-like protein